MSLGPELHERIAGGVRRQPRAELGIARARRAARRCGSMITGSMSASGVWCSSRGPNRGPAITTRPPPRLPTYSLTISQKRSLSAAARHVVEEDHVVGEELAALGRERRQEQHVRLADPRIGRAEERAEALHADQLVAVKDLLDEPPFPGRLVGDVHQPQVVVDDVDLPRGLVVLIDDFAVELVGAGGELEAAGLFGRERQLDRFDGLLRA